MTLSCARCDDSPATVGMAVAWARLDDGRHLCPSCARGASDVGRYVCRTCATEYPGYDSALGCCPL